MSPVSLGTANNSVAARPGEMLIIHDDARVISLPAENAPGSLGPAPYIRFMGNEYL